MSLPRRLTIAAIGGDALALVAAVFARTFHLPGFPLGPGTAQADPHRTLLLVAILLPPWLLTYACRGLYSQELLQHGTNLAGGVANAVTLAAVLTLAGTYLAGAERLLPADLIVAMWLAALAFTLLLRVALVRALRYYRHRRPWRVLIAGASQAGVRAANALAARPDMHVVGFLDDFLPLGTAIVPNGRVIGRPADAAQVARTVGVDEMLLVEGALGHESSEQLWRALYATPEMPPLRLVPRAGSELLVLLRPALRGRVAVLVPELGRIAGAGGWAKFGFDRTVALAVLVVAAPFLAVAGLWALVHRRPLLHGTDIVGRGGRRFRRWSLSLWWSDGVARPGTARLDAPTGNELVLLMRKLPCAINVLRGELSLVGPRPIQEEDVPLYGEWLELLLSMRPGLVGPWLLHGDSALTPEEELAMDLAYVRDFSLVRDLGILVRATQRLAARLVAQRGVTIQAAREPNATGPAETDRMRAGADVAILGYPAAPPVAPGGRRR